MAAIDTEALLSEVSAQEPCGADLEYDPEFGELERLAQPRPEQRMGERVIPAEEPDWRAVASRAQSLLGRTKDLRVAMHLVRALLRTAGFPGLRDGLAVLQGLLQRHWEGLHPRLDPDDDYDPTMRVNIVAGLCDPDSVLRPLREAPLVSSRMLGRFALRDLAMASGEIPPPSGTERPSPEVIEGAFMEAAPEELTATAEAIGKARDLVVAIEASITERVGSGRAQSLDALTGLLRDAQRAVSERLARRGLGAAAEPAGDAGAPDAAGPLPAGRAPLSRGPAVAGQVASREDVARLLDLICEYYRQFEPASPVPLLLQRAKRLVPMTFLEIVRDLAPDGLTQVENIRGPLPPEGGEGAPQGTGW
jgi:type VI secretion system protein ImpA